MLVNQSINWVWCCRNHLPWLCSKPGRYFQLLEIYHCEGGGGGGGRGSNNGEFRNFKLFKRYSFISFDVTLPRFVTELRSGFDNDNGQSSIILISVRVTQYQLTGNYKYHVVLHANCRFFIWPAVLDERDKSMDLKSSGGSPGGGGTGGTVPPPPTFSDTPKVPLFT